METYYLKIRRQEDNMCVQCWLIKSDGPAHSGLLYGEILPDTVDDLAKILGLLVVDDTDNIVVSKPKPHGIKLGRLRPSTKRKR